MKQGKTMPRGARTTITAGGAQGGTVRVESNAIPFLAPGVGLLLAWIMALTWRALFRDDPYVWYWSLLVALCYGLLTLFVWRIGQRHPLRVQLVLTGAVGFVSGWTWYLVGVQHQTWRPHVVYLFAALLTWGCSIFYLANKGTGDGGHNPLEAIGGAVAKIHAINSVHTTDHGEVTAVVRTELGTPAAALQRQTAELASAVPGMRPDGVRIQPDATDATKAIARFSPVDRLATPPQWPGPSILSGGTASDSVRLGVRASGGWSEFWLTAAPDKMRTAPLVAVVGMSGSGKTGLVKILGLEILSRLDTELWLADPRKGGQLAPWLKRGASREAYGRRDVAIMLRDFLAGVSERSDLLGAHGCDVWSSECCWRKHGIRLRVLICDEAAAIASDLPELLTNIGESARSTGSVPIFLFQRGTGDRFPTSARSQFNTHICLGVQEEADAVHGGLPDDVLEAGAMPWLWGADQAGKHILAAPGVPADERAIDCRTFDTRGAEQLMSDWADHYTAERAALDAGGPRPARTRKEMELAADALAQGLVEAGVDLSTLPRVGVDGGLEYGDAESEISDMVSEDLDADSDGELAALAEDMPAADPEDADEIAGMDLNSPLPDMPVPPGDDVVAIEPKVSSAQARAALYAYIVALRDRAGARTLSPVDVIEWVVTTLGFRKTWLYKALEQFEIESECGPALLRSEGDREPYTILGAS